MQLHEATFELLRSWMHQQTGILFPKHKKTLVQQRLLKRLAQLGLPSYEAYLALLRNPLHEQECAIAVDLLTTHETSFFREARHYSWLKHHLATRLNPAWQVWCAACSSGEEAWSLAMLLADYYGLQVPWQILASDISLRTLELAHRAHYALSLSQKIPPDYLKKYCLKGVGPQHGTFLIERSLRQHVRFQQINLCDFTLDNQQFDVIFLRNVLIYFRPEEKQQILEHVVAHLANDGVLFVSHSESLYGLHPQLRAASPGVYYKQDILPAYPEHAQ